MRARCRNCCTESWGTLVRISGSIIIMIIINKKRHLVQTLQGHITRTKNDDVFGRQRKKLEVRFRENSRFCWIFQVWGLFDIGLTFQQLYKWLMLMQILNKLRLAVAYLSSFCQAASNFSNTYRADHLWSNCKWWCLENSHWSLCQSDMCIIMMEPII